MQSYALYINYSSFMSCLSMLENRYDFFPLYKVGNWKIHLKYKPRSVLYFVT